MNINIIRKNISKIIAITIITLLLSFWSGTIANNLELSENKIEDNEQVYNLKIPFFWETNIYNLSIPVLTIVIWLIDWFNPCALWILLFLISILIWTWDRKKLIILWSTFIIASWISYFLFMAAWLNLILFFWLLLWIRLLVWWVWIWFWIYSIKKFFQKDSWCDVMWWKRREFFFERIKKAINNKNLLFSMIWISILAFAVNLLELLCSAWFPAIYTSILASQDMLTYQYYLYLLMYIFFFLLDHFIIFWIAVFAFKLVWISTKYVKWLNLVWWIIMILLWLAIIFKPEYIMFW